MSTLLILSELSERGIRIEPDGQDVFVTPADRLTPELVERIKAEKPALIRALDRVRREAGNDWVEVAADPRQLKAFCELLMIGDMRYRGIAPDHYTAFTTCRHCGPVPIFEGATDAVLGCPWCHNRIQGLPMPGGDV